MGLVMFVLILNYVVVPFFAHAAFNANVTISLSF